MDHGLANEESNYIMPFTMAGLQLTTTTATIIHLNLSLNGKGNQMVNDFTML